MKRVFAISGLAIGKAWLAFSAIAASGALLFACLDHDSLLRSDDPYIPSAIVGIVAAVLAAVYVIVHESTGRKQTAQITCVSLLACWCGLLGAVALTPGEGNGFAGFFAVASAIAVLLAWPLCAFHLSWIWKIVLSCLGILFLLGRVHVAIYMANRFA